jgi:FAD/FMN-containing dehydrogenase
LTASADENGDLFFAIRGGGGNFGVVTQFVYKLSPQRRMVYSGEAVFSVTRMEEIVEHTNTWWKTASGQEGLFVAFINDPDGNVSFSLHRKLEKER